MAARIVTVLMLCLMLLYGCGPASVIVPGTASNAPVEPQRGSVAPEFTVYSAQPTARTAADKIRITWLERGQRAMDSREEERQLSILQGLLRKGGWNVILDFLPLEYWDNPDAYATDAYMGSMLSTGHNDGPSVLDLAAAGITLDAQQLCTRYAPVLAEKYADLLTPTGIPMRVLRGMEKSARYLLLLQEKVPQKWLYSPPTMSEIIKWVETSGVTLGRTRQEINSSFPFDVACNAWAAEKGYYSLDQYGISGELYAKFGDATMQPVPLEDIEGFDDIYRRLFALYRAGRYIELTNRPLNSVGYLKRDLNDKVDEGLLLTNQITAEDVVAIPVVDTAWEASTARGLQKNGTQTVMAIRKDSQHAEQLVQLAQWALTTREGYDLVNYGVLDEDYTLKNGRWNRVKGSDMEKQVSWFAYDNTMERIRVDQPGNAAEAAGATSYIKLPVLDLSKIGEYDNSKYVDPLDSIMLPITEANSWLIDRRYELLSGYWAEKAVNPERPPTADWGLQQIRQLSQQGDVQNLVKAYQKELSKLVSK